MAELELTFDRTSRLGNRTVKVRNVFEARYDIITGYLDPAAFVVGSPYGRPRAAA
ncbi:MAG: hypothetical protein WCK39_06260 [Methanomassiliicoccales archaeon]